MRIVMKFGGTSVSSEEGIKKCIEIVKRSVLDGNEVVVVVSAMAGVTNKILEAISSITASNYSLVTDFIEELTEKHKVFAKTIIRDQKFCENSHKEIESLIGKWERVLTSISYLREVTPRSQDYIVSFGEKLSASIVCAALKDAGVKAEWYTGGDAGIVTDDRFGNASPLMEITTYQVKKILELKFQEGIIPVVTGYIAHTQDSTTTTLGRGGSDYTATILGVALDVDEICIWTDVDGLMTADPKIEPFAKTIPTVSYVEAMEMAYFGAKGLHPRALEPAANREICVRIKNTFNPEEEGTLIEKNQSVKSIDIAKAIAIIKDVALVTVSGAGMAGTPGVAAKVFGILGENHVNILMISQGSSEANISLIIPRDRVETATNRLELALLGSGDIRGISAEKDVCIIAIVGAGMKGTPGVAARVFTAVADKGVNVRMIAQGSSELNISFVVKETDGINTVRTLHREFQLDQ
jgi:aspartate kinase